MLFRRTPFHFQKILALKMIFYNSSLLSLTHLLTYWYIANALAQVPIAGYAMLEPKTLKQLLF